MKADGTGQTRLTSDPLPDNYPSWTADGRQIVFQRGGFDSGEIYVMNANGTDPTNLTNDPAPDITPATAPKGRKIVFGSTRGGSGGLFTMQANGSRSRAADYNIRHRLGSELVAVWPRHRVPAR